MQAGLKGLASGVPAQNGGACQGMGKVPLRERAALNDVGAEAAAQGGKFELPGFLGSGLKIKKFSQARHQGEQVGLAPAGAA